MNILFRAILTGFGLRVGAEIAKAVATKVKQRFEPTETDAERSEDGEADEDEGSGVPTTEPDPPDL